MIPTTHTLFSEYTALHEQYSMRCNSAKRCNITRRELDQIDRDLRVCRKKMESIRDQIDELFENLEEDTPEAVNADTLLSKEMEILSFDRSLMDHNMDGRYAIVKRRDLGRKKPIIIERIFSSFAHEIIPFLTDNDLKNSASVAKTWRLINEHAAKELLKPYRLLRKLLKLKLEDLSNSELRPLARGKKGPYLRSEMRAALIDLMIKVRQPLRGQVMTVLEGQHIVSQSEVNQLTVATRDFLASLGVSEEGNGDLRGPYEEVGEADGVISRDCLPVIYQLCAQERLEEAVCLMNLLSGHFDVLSDALTHLCASNPERAWDLFEKGNEASRVSIREKLIFITYLPEKYREDKLFSLALDSWDVGSRGQFDDIRGYSLPFARALHLHRIMDLEATTEQQTAALVAHIDEKCRQGQVKTAFMLAKFIAEPKLRERKLIECVCLLAYKDFKNYKIWEDIQVHLPLEEYPELVIPLINCTLQGKKKIEPFSYLVQKYLKKNPVSPAVHEWFGRMEDRLLRKISKELLNRAKDCAMSTPVELVYIERLVTVIPDQEIREKGMQLLAAAREELWG